MNKIPQCFHVIHKTQKPRLCSTDLSSEGIKNFLCIEVTLPGCKHRNLDLRSFSWSACWKQLLQNKSSIQVNTMWHNALLRPWCSLKLYLSQPKVVPIAQIALKIQPKCLNEVEYGGWWWGRLWLAGRSGSSLPVCSRWKQEQRLLHVFLLVWNYFAWKSTSANT